MDGNRMSDFSIERILSSQLDRKQLDSVPDGHLPGVPGGFSLESASPRAPVPFPVPMPGCLHFRGLCFGNGFCPCTAGFRCHHAEISFCTHFGPNPPDGSEAAHSGSQHPGGPVQYRQRVRMRTVFTDSQTRQLEALFELTDYPAVEARAEVARSTGLSEETVRVWFKNRRARRKKQRSGSKVRSPCPSPSTTAASSEKNFSSFL